VLFICFLNWTDQGAKAVKGVAARHEALKGEIAGLGGRLIGGYVTRGQYDGVLVAEMPGGDAMTELTVAITSRGNVRTRRCGHTYRKSSQSSRPRCLEDVSLPDKVWIKPMRKLAR